MNDQENELNYESVEPMPVQQGTYVEDGLVYNDDGTPVTADNFLVEHIEPQKRFVNEFTRGAKIPRGVVKLDENGLEIDGSLNVDKSPMNLDLLKQVSEIMGNDFTTAFGSGKALKNNKEIKISTIKMGNNSN